MLLNLLQNFNVSVEVTPLNVNDGAETALVKTLEETDMPVVGNPELLVVKESGKNQSHIDTDLIHFLQVFCCSKRVCNNLPKEQFTFESLLSISLSILA